MGTFDQWIRKEAGSTYTHDPRPLLPPYRTWDDLMAEYRRAETEYPEMSFDKFIGGFRLSYPPDQEQE